MDQAIITLLVLAFVTILFVTEKVPIAVSALMASVSLCLLGILTPQECFSGFSNQYVILFGSMFVVGRAILKSGLAQCIGNFVVKTVGAKEGPLLLSLMVLTIAMSAFASNTGTVACLMPLVIGVCISAKIAFAPILMSLAIAANVGCILTMVGTPPNMIAVAELSSHGFLPFGFFEFSIIALPMAFCAVIYMYLFGRKILPTLSADGGVIMQSNGDIGTHKQRVIAVLILIFVITGLIIGIPGLNPAMVALIAAVLCVLTGCITEKQAYKGIDWPTIFVFGGMLPVATAMQKTGAGELIANTVISFIGENPSDLTVVASVFCVACLFSQFMPNTATATLLVPISMSIASKLGISPYGVVMSCVIGASCSFATPIATQCNMMILGPSGLHFKDYLKVGLPLIFVSLVMCMIIIPVVWPFVKV